MRELPRGNTSKRGTFLDPAYDASDRSVVTFPGKIKGALFVAAFGVNCDAHLAHVLSLAWIVVATWQGASRVLCWKPVTDARRSVVLTSIIIFYP